jgi:hypothetical protein
MKDFLFSLEGGAPQKQGQPASHSAWPPPSRFSERHSQKSMTARRHTIKTIAARQPPRQTASAVRIMGLDLRVLTEVLRAARWVDKAAFGKGNDFGQAHQALLKTIDRARQFIAV